LNIFRKPTADVLAAIELEDAERELLLAQRQQAYAAKLAEFYQERIKALKERAQ
jgi:hypothetical protein